MAILSPAARASLLAVALLSVSLAGATPENIEDCESEEDGQCMLQLHGGRMNREYTLVNCTYSDTMCSGNQCCPGANETGWKTYPCPSAEPNYEGCEENDVEVFTITYPRPWMKMISQLHLAGKVKNLQLFTGSADMEVSMSQLAQSSKASILKTPRALFGQRLMLVAEVPVRQGSVLFSCHYLDMLRAKPEVSDRRFFDPEFQTPAFFASSVDLKFESRYNVSDGICHSPAAAPDNMRYVLMEKKDGSRHRLMQECHTHGWISEMCHFTELVVVDSASLHELDESLGVAAEEKWKHVERDEEMGVWKLGE